MIALGVISFLASFCVGGGGSLEGSLVAGLLNPLFLIGVPLGLYFYFGRAKHEVVPTVAFYFRSPAGMIFGPYTKEEFLELESSGRILSETPIASWPSGPWKTARELRMESNSLPDATDTVRFFIQRDSYVLGPYTRRQIVELEHEGQIASDTAISTSTSGPWKLASELKARVNSTK